MVIRLIIAVSLLLAAGGTVSAAVGERKEEIHVVPCGADSVSGKSTCHLLAEAFERLREVKTSDTCYIRVHAGDYYADRPLVIDRPLGFPVVVTGEGAAKPRIMGGIKVEGWEPCGCGGSVTATCCNVTNVNSSNSR